MKSLTLLLSPLILLLMGCGQQEIAGTDQTEQAARAGVTYSTKNGLLVSPETSRFIGLETVEVSERPVRATREITARVFRAATTNEPRALASAVVSAADAAMLWPGQTSIRSPSSPAAEVVRIDRSGEAQTGMVEAILQVDDLLGVRSDGLDASSGFALPSTGRGIEGEGWSGRQTTDHAHAGLALSVGGYITVKFAIGSTNAVTVVPNAALFHTTAGDFVYLENGAHFARAVVTVGRTDGEFTEITDGLLPGDKVVVKSVMTLWMTELHNVNGGDACCIKQEKK